MIRSGVAAAIFSNSSLSTFVSTVGSDAEPTASFAHGPNRGSPSRSNQVVAATGTTPTARQSSCSFKPAVTTRFGSVVIVVSPNLCLIVTGYAPSSTPPALAEALGGAPVPERAEALQADSPTATAERPAAEV